MYFAQHTCIDVQRSYLNQNIHISNMSTVSPSTTTTTTVPDNNKLRTGRLLCIISFALLFHASYSMIQFKHFVTATNNPHLSIPYDIIIECILSLLLCSYGGLLLVKPLQPIYTYLIYQHKQWDSLTPVQTEYVNVRNRGRILQEIQAKLKKSG